MVLTRPAEAFTVMKREGGFSEPLIYASHRRQRGRDCGYSCLSILLHSFGMFADQRNAIGAMAGMGIGSIGLDHPCSTRSSSSVLFIVAAGIVHLCLMIVGGANQPFRNDFSRRVLHTGGQRASLQLIPVCGGVIAAVWGIVVNCIGLARAHETDTGRARAGGFSSVDRLLWACVRDFVYGRRACGTGSSLARRSCRLFAGHSPRARRIMS